MSDQPDGFTGAIAPPADPRYPALVRGFNLRFVGAPQYVHVCGSAEQVVQAVQAALDAGLRITARGGGHCYEDFVSGNDGGVIIDLAPLNRVGRAADGFFIEGGCTLWNVYTQLYKQYGVTLPGGSCYSVGAGGHIIGGGYGLLSRKYGLTIDHLTAVELVHVDAQRRARLITVRRDAADPDERTLFWAHCGGGGGNFGIVVRYLFADLPLAPSYAYLTSLAWNWSDLDPPQFRQLVQQYGAFLAQHSAVDSPFKDMFMLLHLTHKSAQQIVLTVQYVGEHVGLIDRFIHAMKLDRASLTAQRVAVGYVHHRPMPPETQRLPWLDATQTLNGSGPNRRGKYKSAYMIQPFPERQIDVMWQYLTTDSFSNPAALLQVDSYGCQINAVAPEATAVPQRSSIMKLQYQTYWNDPTDDAANLGWIRAFYTEMYGAAGPYPDGIMDGCYVNYPDADLVDWPYLYYKDGYPRLQQTKARWDAHNVFNHQQSIRPPADPAR